MIALGKKNGFTLIEMLIVIAIIASLSTLTLLTFGKIRRQQRDTNRVSDMSQLQIALAAYKRDLGIYPSIITGGEEIRSVGNSTTTVYMAKVPIPPSERDGSCASYALYSSYYYLPSSDFKSYCLFFCLGNNSSELTAGAKIANPFGVVNTYLNNYQCW